ncbi:sulfurtransferase [Sphingomonas nostoxanthinifaciens]|uniref:sulfurtransferase n=1 Tax=Sphingomonas nostoxanthinifaciens TaxID=2872652 RepID=UPI001CC1C74F|nr:sulfurtransferase [Sphingomonas nostoxanthinifaciens]UAK25179.1 sulfurtransferase [Sphingomonas nostoxanthinifaciens]
MTFTTLIDPAALDRLIADGTVALFDCRFDLADPAAGRARYDAGRIPGAAYLHLDDDLSGLPTGANGRHPLPDPHAFAARLAAAGVQAGQQIVAYDDAGGAFAARLWWLAKWIGHEAVAVLDGGLQAWAQASLSLEQGLPAARAPGDFAVGAMPGRGIAGADDILRSLSGNALLVIDARTPERFAGQPNALDPVAGHIPGARNRFYRDNLTAEGRFRPAETLAADYAALIGDRPLDQVVLQCGSGVTAAHDLLAMEHAGLAGARLYPGSWSEWIADPARPVARD